MEKKKKLTAMLVIGTLAVVLCVIGMLVLPETLVVQVSLNGEAGTTVAKPLGLLVPGAMTVILAVLGYVLQDGRKCIGVSLVGLLALALDFLFNI